MSLKDVILEIAEQMETDAKEDDIEFSKRDVIAWARQLRSACKAAEDPPKQIVLPGMGMMQGGDDAAVQHRTYIEKAKEEFRKEGHVMEEAFATKMCELVDAPGWDQNSPPTHFELPAAAPVGAKVPVGDAVYVLKDDGKLHWSAFETEKFNANKKGTS